MSEFALLRNRSFRAIAVTVLAIALARSFDVFVGDNAHLILIASQA
jgi:hypothetical protein